MVADALAGKINLIITKSVSRFARNTVDSLTIISSLAQEESRSISENVTWGHRKRFADGKVDFAYSRVLGLEKKPEGNIVVNQEQAEIVKLIFRRFLEGMTPHSIAAQLTDMGIKFPGGKDKWNSATVRRMLSNEKYKDDAMPQKEFTVDYLQKKIKRNEGEVLQYYVEGNHEAIIEPSVFDLMQTELAKRSKKSEERYSGVSIFSNKIKFAEFGSWYDSKVWHSNDKYHRVIYRCNHKFDGNRKCEALHATEEEIIAAFIKAMNMVITERDEIIGNIKLIRQTVCDTAGLEEE